MQCILLCHISQLHAMMPTLLGLHHPLYSKSSAIYKIKQNQLDHCDLFSSENPTRDTLSLPSFQKRVLCQLTIHWTGLEPAPTTIQHWPSHFSCLCFGCAFSLLSRKHAKSYSDCLAAGSLVFAVFQRLYLHAQVQGQEKRYDHKQHGTACLHRLVVWAKVGIRKDPTETTPNTDLLWTQY